MTSERYEIRFQAAARPAIAGRLPESVAAAVLEFCEAALALSPRRVGKPLFGPLAGCHGARRGTYRIVYRIDEQARIVDVLDIDHRTDIYHRSLRRHETAMTRRRSQDVTPDNPRPETAPIADHINDAMPAHPPGRQPGTCRQAAPDAPVARRHDRHPAASAHS